MKKIHVTIASVAMLVTVPAKAQFYFGDDWKVTSAPTCTALDSKKKNVSKYFKHVGVDYMAKAGKKVTVNTNVFFYKTHTENYWRSRVIACTLLDKSGKCDVANPKNVFYTFLHMELPKTAFKAGQSLNGVVIGTVADIPYSHIHYSKRVGAWDSDALSFYGALPPAECVSGKQGRPNFQEKFVDPGAKIFTIEK
jgi:hypothetical protein